MTEKELIYGELDWSKNPDLTAPRRSPRGRFHSESATPTVYAEIDFKTEKPLTPSQIQRQSTFDFPPPPPDFFENYSPIHQTLDEVKPLRKKIPPPVPPRRHTNVIYPANPALKPAQTKPRDPACNFVGLSDERDLTPIDPELLAKYAPNNPVLPDSVFKNDKIYSLKIRNIDQFLKCRDVAMILFYDPDDLGQKAGLKKRYSDAASITSRYNHGYGSVNCQVEKQLCDMYKITKTPVFSVFSLSKLVGSFRDSTMDPVTLKRYVENVPLIKTH